MAIRLRTGTPAEARRTLSRVINMVMNDEISTGKANTITLTCNAILNSMRIDEQQKQLDALEQLVNERIEGKK